MSLDSAGAASRSSADRRPHVVRRAADPRRGHGSFECAVRPPVKPCRFPAVQLSRIVRPQRPPRRCSPCCVRIGATSSRRASVTRSTSCAWVDHQEVHRADVAAGSDGRPEREHRPTDHFACPLRPRGCWPAAGRPAGGADPRRPASSYRRSTAEPTPSRSATSRSTSVMRAARTRYSTLRVVPRTGDADAKRRSTGADRSWPAEPRTTGTGEREQLDEPAPWVRRRPVFAFGSPMSMIRHRFGGHLRRRLRPCRVAASSTTAPGARSWRRPRSRDSKRRSGSPTGQAHGGPRSRRSWSAGPWTGRTRGGGLEAFH